MASRGWTRSLARLGRRLLGRSADRRPEPFTGLAARPLAPDATAIWGFLHSEIGLGSSARGFAEVLARLDPGRLCHAVPLPGRDRVPFPADPPSVRPGTNLVVINPPELLQGEAFLPHRALAGTRRIGYWAWELARTPPRWRPAFDLVDEVWTCSHFAAAALAAASDRPVRVLPHVVPDWDHLDRTAARARLPALPATGFLFLTAFDFASGFARKNPLATIAAFERAFGRGPDGPFLIVKYHGGGARPEEEARLLRIATANRRIVLISEVLPPETLRLLHDAVDAFVSLHRAEGFGLNIAEAMIAGRPVIVTDYSGNTDFTSPDTALPIGWRPIPIGRGEYYDWQDQVWADPDVEAAAAAMRRLVDDPAFTATLGARARAHMLAAHGPAAIAERMRALLADRPR